MFGLNLVVNRGKTIFICDTSVIEYPDANQLAEMAKSAARVVRLFDLILKLLFYHTLRLVNQQQKEQKG